MPRNNDRETISQSSGLLSRLANAARRLLRDNSAQRSAEVQDPVQHEHRHRRRRRKHGDRSRHSHVGHRRRHRRQQEESWHVVTTPAQAEAKSTLPDPSYTDFVTGGFLKLKKTDIAVGEAEQETPNTQIEMQDANFTRSFLGEDLYAVDRSIVSVSDDDVTITFLDGITPPIAKQNAGTSSSTTTPIKTELVKTDYAGHCKTGATTRIKHHSRRGHAKKRLDFANVHSSKDTDASGELSR